MNMQEIRQIAKQNGVKAAKLNKINLIRSIQKNEGNYECFASATDGQCDQVACLWHKDCIPASLKNGTH